MTIRSLSRRLLLHGAALLCLASPLAAEIRYEVPPIIGGPGGVYLQAQPGELEVQICKRDLNLSDRYQNSLYAFLLTPDRRVVAKLNLHDRNEPSPGQPGAISQETLRTRVDIHGVYLLLVEVTGFDGKRHDLAWGFSTNAERYQMIRGEYSTGRGKTPLLLEALKDERATLFFSPTLFRFALNAETREKNGVSLDITRPQIKPEKLLVNTSKPLTASFTADLLQPEPWEIEIKGHSVSLDIEGVTFWRQWGGFAHESHGFFTFHRDAFFPMADLRWALTPYFSVVDLHEKQQGEVAWKVRNHAPLRDYRLRVELISPENAKVNASLPLWEQTVKAGEDAEIKLAYNGSKVELPAGGEIHRLRVSSPDLPGYETYSTVTFVAPTTARKVELPAKFEPFSHFAEQYHYAPSYPLNQVDFDFQNSPYVRETVSRDRSTGVFNKRGDQWVLDDFESALKRALPNFQRTVLGSAFYSTRTSFDRNGGIYTTISATESGNAADAVRVLLYQPTPGAGFQAYVLDQPGLGLADVEGFTGHNTTDAPPAVLLYRIHKQTSGQVSDRATLELLLPQRKPDGTLALEQRKLVSDHAITLCTHSGGASTVASHGDWVYLVYGEVTDEPKSVPGVPTSIVAYHRKTGEQQGPVFLGYAPPVNDMHNSSGLVIDSEGTLHVVLGAHGKNPFQYVRSRKPYSITDGWSAPQAVLNSGLKLNGVGPGESGAQTYVGLVCDAHDTLHLAFRRDLQNVEGHFAGHTDRYRALSLQRKRKGSAWEAPKEVIIPPLPGYSVYYHKLTVDRRGWLFLFLSYRPLHSVYRSELPATGNHAALLVSKDDGESWELAGEDVFQSQP